jgi:acylphosphatase
MTARKHLFVSGRVQGVFYRDTCRRIATQAGVAGWASNLSDGRVEIVLEGGEDAVARVVSWCREGTEYSRVESVEVTDEQPEGLSGFAIR